MLLSACAGDPFAERRALPRSAPGYVAAARSYDMEGAVREVEQRAAEALDARVVTDCAEPRSSVVSRVEFLAAPNVDTARIFGPVGVERGFRAQIHRYRIAVAACGETRLHAVYPLFPLEGGRFETGVPGGSIASLGLQRDVVDQVGPQVAGIIAAGFPEGACDAAASAPWVVDTALLAPPRKGRWSEAWTFTACGVRRTVTVSFEETATGARFSAPIPLAERSPPTPAPPQSRIRATAPPQAGE